MISLKGNMKYFLILMEFFFLDTSSCHSRLLRKTSTSGLLKIQHPFLANYFSIKGVFRLLIQLRSFSTNNFIRDFSPSIWFAGVLKFTRTSINISIVFTTSSSIYLLILLGLELSFRTPWTTYSIHFWSRRINLILCLLNTVHFYFWFQFIACNNNKFRMLLFFLQTFLIHFIRTILWGILAISFIRFGSFKSSNRSRQIRSYSVWLLTKYFLGSTTYKT